jgi:4-alpha-glucanotransferase
MNKRGSGILLHITSLPSQYGIGDLGSSAYRFVDFLKAAGQRYWQILPLNPSNTYVGSSPYASYSAFAGNPLLISPELLVTDGLLQQDELDHSPMPDHKVDYRKVIEFKTRILQAAYDRHMLTGRLRPEFEDFCDLNELWLDDFALFVALKQHFDETYWLEWEPAIRDRQPATIKKMKEQLSNRVLRAKFYQFLFFRQWFSLKSYCEHKGIEIVGDVPIYVSSDSSDVWAHPEFFKLDEEKNPIYVSGAPPDYFSETGQRWGSPVYNWDLLEKTGFSWWLNRVGHNLNLFHRVRLDHFRGFIAYWEIPAEEETAVNGKWVDAPGAKLFQAIKERYPGAMIIAEDLGVITDEVREVMNRFKFPGMKILQFAFGADMPTNPYIPHNYTTTNCVVYTGTHDNNTTQGWYAAEASPENKANLAEYLGNDVRVESLHWDMIRIAAGTIAEIMIVPMQDFLGLGADTRMNTPQIGEGNWQWRVLTDQLSEELVKKIARITWLYNRVSS